MHSTSRDADQLGRLRVLPHRPITPHGITVAGSAIQPRIEQVVSGLFRPVLVNSLRVLPQRPLTKHHVHSAVVSVQPQVMGRGRITGTTKVSGSPDVPKASLVRLYARRTGQLIAQTYSDATGGYVFANLNPDQLYTVVAHDESGLFNAVIADNLEATR